MTQDHIESIGTPEGYWNVFRERFFRKYGGRGFVVLEREMGFGARHMYYHSLADLKMVYGRYPQDIDTGNGLTIKDLAKELESWQRQKR